MEWEVLEHTQGQCDEHGLFPADIWHDGVYVRTMAFSSVKAARDYEVLLNAPEERTIQTATLKHGAGFFWTARAACLEQETFDRTARQGEFLPADHVMPAYTLSHGAVYLRGVLPDGRTITFAERYALQHDQHVNLWKWNQQIVGENIMEDAPYLRTLRCEECGHQDTVVWYPEWPIYADEAYQCVACTIQSEQSTSNQ